MTKLQDYPEKNATMNDKFVKRTENQPLTVFIFLLVLGLIFGSVVFCILLIPTDFSYIKLSPEGAGGFLQGAWGTAGSLAAAFVAIVLAQQALVLTRRQNEDQNKQDKKALTLQKALSQLQREQNLILQQNTPEYQIAYRAAMSSTKLDSLQIIIGSLERKKFRGKDSTVADVLRSREHSGDEFEIKREVKEELLGSRYIEFAAGIAEKMYGTNSRLEIETLVSELIVSSKLTLDKLLINRLNKTIHQLVANCMADILRVLADSNTVGLDNAKLNIGLEIFQFVDYERVKKSTGNTQNSISKSAYYFVNILFAQMRSGGYDYGEESLLKKNIENKLGVSTVPFKISDQIPIEVGAFNQGFCVVTPFDFQRQTLLVDLEFPDRKNTSVRRYLIENHRGRPDLEVMNAINNTGDGVNPIIFLDQTESAKDSIQKNKWLTFSEHLALWESMQQLHNLIVAKEHQLELIAENFIEYVRTDVADGLSENEIQKACFEKILPRYWKVSDQKIETALGRMSNYDVILLQAMKELQGYKPEKSIIKSDQSINLRYFVIELLTMLKLDEYSTSSGRLIDNNVFQSFLKEHEEVISIVNELAKRPFFERPFYGWILPDFQMTCSLNIAKNKSIGFVGIYYLLESKDDFVFKPNSLYNWLTAPNLHIDPSVRNSVAIAI